LKRRHHSNFGAFCLNKANLEEESQEGIYYDGCLEKRTKTKRRELKDGIEIFGERINNFLKTELAIGS
jgi:hypothetical protein